MTTRTVTIDGISLDVEFDHQPYERPTLEYPGCDEDYDINNVYVHKTNIDIMSILSDDTIERIIKELEKAKGEM